MHAMSTLLVIGRICGGFGTALLAFAMVICFIESTAFFLYTIVKIPLIINFSIFFTFYFR